MKAVGFVQLGACKAPIQDLKHRGVFSYRGTFAREPTALYISPGLDPRVASCPSCSGRPQKKRREEVL